MRPGPRLSHPCKSRPNLESCRQRHAAVALCQLAFYGYQLVVTSRLNSSISIWNRRRLNSRRRCLVTFSRASWVPGAEEGKM